jgi:N-acyl-D-amino-acid deacylase
VTTVVTGNCGGSEEDLDAWFRELGEMGIGLNVASLIGHNTVRRQAMGNENRAATPDELARMKELVAEAMEDGAAGLSTGLIYTPGVYAGTEEVIELAKVAALHGGVYATHIRNEEEGVLEAIAEAIRVGREADIRVEIAHFKVAGRAMWGRSAAALDMIAGARREGIDVTVDQYPYERASTGISMLLPAWALAGGPSETSARLRDPETRARVAADMEKELRAWGMEDYSFATVARFEPDASLEGKNVPEINLLRGREKTLANEILTVMEIQNQGGAQMVYHMMSMEDVERILRHPDTAVASDGGIIVFGEGRPHPRSYGTNARVLAEFVRKRGQLTLEEAVRKMTSLPARTFGFKDRGMIREGMAADLLLFDPAAVQDHATFEDPHRYSGGFEIVLVNGEPVVEDGKLTGRRPGQVLRHFPHDPAE